MWFEIAETGVVSSFKGNTITYSAEKMDQTCAAYDPRRHEAPVVLGDPAHNDPAYGWVERLKRSGSKLYAQIKAVNSQIEADLRQGKYTKKVIEINPKDMYLRRIRLYGLKPFADLDCLSANEGGDFMFFDYDEKNDNPGDVLQRKVIELMSSPRRIDQYGNPIDWNNLTYSKAFEIVCQENPELTQRYVDYLNRIRGRERWL